MYEIVTREDLTPVTKSFEMRAPDVARKAQAGQFVIVRVHDKGERIPLTIADYDRQRGTLTLVVQEVGNTVLSIVGARSVDLLFWEERMQAVSDELIVCTDRGSYGREALVIARQYGIPAVLGTGVATKRIQSGQTIRVDGDTGTVTLWDGVVA